MHEQIWEYWASLHRDIPMAVYEGLLSVLCLGVVAFFSWKGIRKGFVLTARLLLVELVTIIYCSTVIFRNAGEISRYDFHPFWSYAAIQEGREELLVENIMNVVVFVPIGLLIGIGFAKCPWWKVIGNGCLLSMSIEVMQLVFKRGFCEVDDVMHNTIGCMIGYMLVKGGLLLRQATGGRANGSWFN